MLGDMLQTKLYVPRLRPNLIPRPHLIARLNQGWQTGSKLTLISAPAGFGKTTLISEWIAGCEQPFAWFSLGEKDGDLPRFLAYLIAALQTLAPSFGARAWRLLNSPPPLPTESILTALLNEIAGISPDFALVLDDYHEVDAQSVDQALTFLLEHLPPQMHLVITTREDPQLPLPRLRARGQLTELRAADLRFTPDEAAAFLNQVMRLDLSTEEVAVLEARTEGWIAGLQLAALSVQGRADMHGFIQAFAGDNRYIVDYLVEEVLQRQPENVRRFLLQTSILDRLHGSLCDAVRFGAAETPDSSAGSAAALSEQSSVLLETLERSNLFVVPLDDSRRWYRYHHLFADVLQTHIEEQPEGIAVLHQRASAWYERQGLTAEAVRHALVAEDFQRAARIIELAWAEMDRSRQSATWLGWVKKLPDEVVRFRPVLSVGYAWALLDTGELEAAETRLRDAERCLNAIAAGSRRLEVISGRSGSSGADVEQPAPNLSGGRQRIVVADEEEFKALPGTIAAAHTYYALALGDMPGTIKYAQQALDFLPEADHLRRGTPAALLGLALWASGDLSAAQRAFTEAMSSYQNAGNILFAITGTYVLVEMKMAQGRLREGVRICEASLQLARAHDESTRRGAADLHTALSTLCLEQNDLKAVAAHLRRSKALGEPTALPRWRYRWCLAQARVRAAEGKLDDTLNWLDEAQRQYVRGPVPEVRPIAAWQTRVWIAQGRLADALSWVQEQGLSVDDDLNYLREFEHITLSRLLIARYEREQAEECVHAALALLERLRQAAAAGGRAGSLIEILVLQALAHQAQGLSPLALAALEYALRLAEPEGYVRIFVDEGHPMARLLAEAGGQGIMPDYIHKLLAAFEAEPRTAAGNSPAFSPPAAQPLVEPLSERELEVLHLLAQGLSNREIGERLFLALPTVKGHNRNIYSKLQVRRRTEAIARARELGLL